MTSLSTKNFHQSVTDTRTFNIFYRKSSECQAELVYFDLLLFRLASIGRKADVDYWLIWHADVSSFIHDKCIHEATCLANTDQSCGIELKTSSVVCSLMFVLAKIITS